MYKNNNNTSAKSPLGYLGVIRFLLEKEFKQILRNSFLPKMIIAFPLMVLLVFPWAANFEVKNINLSLIDHDHSVYSQRLTEKIISSNYFRLTNISQSYEQALIEIEKDRADIILEIPANFEKNLVRENTADLMLSINTVNGTKGGLGNFYISNIITDFNGEIRAEVLPDVQISNIPIIEIDIQYRYNPHLDYKVFMIPALLVILLTLACGALPALNIVGEKEAGTIEQINVTPVSKFTFILSKLLPYWIIGFVMLSIAFLVAFLIYGMTPMGNIATFYFSASIYILTVSGLGLVVSNYSDTMQQAMFIMFFFLIIFILVSGIFTPISSMPEWAQYITRINPLRYFMEIMRMIYLKGSGIADMLPQLGILAGFAVLFNVWAVVSYKKKS
jgi:ABC-2 type transport system permease protein